MQVRRLCALILEQVVQNIQKYNFDCLQANFFQQSNHKKGTERYIVGGNYTTEHLVPFKTFYIWKTMFSFIARRTCSGPQTMNKRTKMMRTIIGAGEKHLQ